MITRFEELVAWQRARLLTAHIYEITRRDQFRKDYGLSGQIQRASVSIMSNIAEGFERYGRPEFHQFLSIAKASCAEVRSQLYVAADVGYIEKRQFTILLDETIELGKIIGALRASLKKETKGTRRTSSL